MSRIRSVHPAIFADEDFARLPIEARILLLALGTMSDYTDKFVWDEREIKRASGVANVTEMLSYLQNGFISRDGDVGVIDFTFGFRRRRLSRWDRLRSFIFSRDGYVCKYCGSDKTPLHCDHVIPVTRGGSDDPSNLTTSCKFCNLSKGDRLLSEWRACR